MKLGEIALWRCLWFLFAVGGHVHAVQPETGLYVPGGMEGQDGDPAKLAYIEVQGDQLTFILLAFDANSGAPQLFLSQGRLRDDALNPGQSHAPPFTGGYYPLHAFLGDLFLVEGGACLTCWPAPVQWTRTPVARLELYFASASLATAEIVLRPEFVAPGTLPEAFLNLQRIAFGRPPVVLAHPSPTGPPSFVHHDLRGQWVFVDQSDAGPPLRDEVIRVEFTERTLSPQPFQGQPYSVVYRDPRRDIEFRCASVGTSAGQKAAGCELHRGGLVALSARREDIGMDRIQAMRGELPRIVGLLPTRTNPYRNAGQVIGVRVSMPPAGPLGPEAIEHSPPTDTSVLRAR